MAGQKEDGMNEALTKRQREVLKVLTDAAVRPGPVSDDAYQTWMERRGPVNTRTLGALHRAGAFAREDGVRLALTPRAFQLVATSAHECGATILGPKYKGRTRLWIKQCRRRVAAAGDRCWQHGAAP